GASGRAAQLDRRNLAYEYEAALDAQRVGDYSRSLTYLHAIEQRDPDYKETLFARGFALWKTGQPRAAILAYRAFLARHPDRFQAQFDLGYTLMTLGRCREAIGAFKKTLVLRPNYAEVHLHLATCYEKLGNREAAVQQRALYQ